MGMDYRYLLYFEHDATVEVLEHLATMAVPGPDPTTTLELPDRRVELPFSGWAGTDTHITVDDVAPTWELMTVLCFEPDEAIEDYLDRMDLRTGTADAGDRHDDHGRCRVGIVYLTVHRGDHPGTDSDEPFTLFEFGTPGSSMSVLFFESLSIRRAFGALLSACRGVYGVFDMEEWADLFWLRGEERDDRLPTAEMSLTEIEGFLADPYAPGLSFRAEELVSATQHVMATTGGGELGLHHWLLGLLVTETELPGAFGTTPPEPAALELRHRLEAGDNGVALSEEEVRQRARDVARAWGHRHVELEDLRTVIAETVAAITESSLASIEEV